MEELLQDMQLKKLITIESTWANRLVETIQRAERLYRLYKVFCLPLFNVDNLYWYIYFKDNRN